MSEIDDVKLSDHHKRSFWNLPGKHRRPNQRYLPIPRNNPPQPVAKGHKRAAELHCLSVGLSI